MVIFVCTEQFDPKFVELIDSIKGGMKLDELLQNNLLRQEVCVCVCVCMCVCVCVCAWYETRRPASEQSPPTRGVCVCVCVCVCMCVCVCVCVCVCMCVCV